MNGPELQLIRATLKAEAEKPKEMQELEAEEMNLWQQKQEFAVRTKMLSQSLK